MAEKSMIAEQEAMLLQQKATEAENELQVLNGTIDVDILKVFDPLPGN